MNAVQHYQEGEHLIERATSQDQPLPSGEEQSVMLLAANAHFAAAMVGATLVALNVRTLDENGPEADLYDAAVSS